MRFMLLLVRCQSAISLAWMPVNTSMILGISIYTIRFVSYLDRLAQRIIVHLLGEPLHLMLLPAYITSSNSLDYQNTSCLGPNQLYFLLVLLHSIRHRHPALQLRDIRLQCGWRSTTRSGLESFQERMSCSHTFSIFMTDRIKAGHR